MSEEIIELDEVALNYLNEKEYGEYFTLFAQLKAALANNKTKYLQFQVEYHGSGDSGDYDPAVLIFETDDGKKIDSKEASEVLPEGLIGELSEFIVNKVDYDWYNNDGGGGTAFIDLSNGAFGYQGYWNETVSHDVTKGYKLSGV